MEEPPQDPPELVRLKQSKIWVDVLESLSLSLTAQESISTEIWLKFIKEFVNQDFGDALTNSIESPLPLCLSLLLRLKPLQLLRNLNLLDSSSQKKKNLSNSFQAVVTSLQ